MAQNLNLGSLNLSIGANTDALTAAVGEMKKVSTAVRSLGTRVSNSTKKIEDSFSKQATAIKKTTSAQTKATKAAADAEKALRKEDKALSSTIIKTNSLKAAIERAGASQRDINIVNQAMARFRKNIRGAGNDTAKFAKEQALLNRRLSGVRTRLTRFNSELRKKQMAEAAKQTALFQNKMQDLTKSIQLALGPLSGVASRVTAFTGLINKNTIAIAAMIGVVVALGIILIKAVKAGVTFESQFKQIETQLRTTRKGFKLSAEVVNRLAEEVADATLTSAKLARSAASTLLIFSRVTEKNFKRVLAVSQDVVTVIGGDLVSAARRVARALEDPAKGIDALNRQLAILTAEEILVAKGLAEMEERGKAAEFILRKLESRVGGLALAAATGLAGAFDSLVERIGRFLEIATTAGGILEPITRVLNKFSNNLNEINKNAEQVSGGFRLMRGAMNALAKILESTIDNFRSIVAFVSILVVGGLLSRLIIGITAFRNSIIATNIALAAMNLLAKTNPFLLIATGISIAIAAFSAFGSQGEGVVRTIKEIEEEIKEVEKRLEQLAPGPFQIPSFQFQQGKDALRQLNEELERTKKISKAVKKSLEELVPGTVFDPRIQKKFRETINNIFATRLTSASNAVIDFAKQFGKVNLVVDDAGKVVIRFLGKLTPAQKQFGEATKGLRILFLETKDAAFVASRDINIFNDAVARIPSRTAVNELEKLREELSLLEIDQRNVLANLEVSPLIAAAAMQELRLQIQGLELDLNEATSPRFSKRADVLVRTFNNFENVLGISQKALELFNEDLELLTELRDLGIVKQAQFNQELARMERQLIQNSRAVQEFAGIVSRNFAQMILQGEKLLDVLARIGEQLAEAALQALIFNAIIGGIGAAFGPAPQATGQSTGSSGGSAVPTGTGSLSSSTLTGVQAPAPTAQLTGTAGPGDGVVININAQGADPGAEARIERAIREMGDDSVRRSVRAVRESRLRG